MSRTRRLGPLLQLAERRSEDAGRQYAAALRGVRQQEQRLAELELHRREYGAGLGAGDGLDPRRLHQYRLFLERLDDAIAQQSQTLERSRAACRDRGAAWEQQRQRERAVSTVIDRQRRRERSAQRRAEQRTEDELAARPRGR